MKRALLARGAWLLMSGVVFIGALLALEMVFRRIDGFRIASVTLRATGTPMPSAVDDAPDRPYAVDVPRADSVSLGWYVETPKPIPRIPMTPELKKRAEDNPTEPWSAFFEWNLAYLREQACRDVRDVVMGNLRDFYYFESTDGSRYPAYRHLAHISPPGWFVSNAFGWRGPDITLNKPLNTIRIAFVGASTTIDSFNLPFSHPELVGYWLNRWAETKGLPYKFEVINAGRMGIDSNSIAAVVTQELVPVEPDLVIYYEGANQFWPTQLVAVDDSRTYDKPKSTFVKRTVAEDYSVLVRRALRSADRVRSRDGSEPRKPPSSIRWPDGLNELDPSLDTRKLPMDLPNILACLDNIRTALARIHSELVLSSFVWVVHDGMKLDLDRDYNLYNYLNLTYWPITYAEMRRIADFQNRVFEKYARTYDVPFIDMAADFPQDPALAGDAVHFTYQGLRLQAWIFLQHLIPLIEGRLADKRLPKPAAVSRSIHPAFAQPSPRRISLDELRSRCR